MVNAKLKDGRGTDNAANIDKDGALDVAIHSRPPIAEAGNPIPFAAFFRNAAGSSNMAVNASAAAPQTFSILQETGYHLYISSVTVQISAPGARLDRFGALPELANGIDFYYFSQQSGKSIIDQTLKTNLDFFRSATAGKGFGSGSAAWIADIAGGAGQDTYFPELDLRQRFGFFWGLKLRAGTNDTLAFDIKDNISTVSVFNIKAYGFKIAI